MGEIRPKTCEGVGITWKTPPSDSNTAENRSSSERWSAQYWREPWEPISSEVQPTQRTVRSGRMLSRSERSSFCLSRLLRNFLRMLATRAGARTEHRADLQRDEHAAAVIHCPEPHVPGVEVAREQNDLVREFGADDVDDGVPRRRALVRGAGRVGAGLVVRRLM